MIALAPASVGSLRLLTTCGPDGSSAVASSVSLASRPSRPFVMPATCAEPKPDLRIVPFWISGPIAALELLMSKKSALTPATAPASRTCWLSAEPRATAPAVSRSALTPSRCRSTVITWASVQPISESDTRWRSVTPGPMRSVVSVRLSWSAAALAGAARATSIPAVAMSLGRVCTHELLPDQTRQRVKRM